MSTRNIGFYEDLTKIIFKLSSNIIKYAPYFFCCLWLCHAATHSLFPFQLRVRTYDLGTPSLEQTQQAVVTVQVIRNNAAPQFILTPYATTISRDLTVLDTVYTVTATDLDFNSFSNVSSCTIINGYFLNIKLLHVMLKKFYRA